MIRLLSFLLLFPLPGIASAQGFNAPPRAAAVAPAAEAPRASAAASNYVLSPNDVVLVKVFQEPDLDGQHRVAKDGSVTFPLIGLIKVGGRTVDGAATLIRDLLAKDYLVNPQVSVNIGEYAKRRFTVLGQVQRPGSYLIPDEETIDLLAAIAEAGGYTRIADPGKIIVKRKVNGREVIHRLNAKAMAKDRQSRGFEIMPDDTITVGESIF